MSVGYFLINLTKKESILFTHLPGETKWELTTNPITSALTTWYLINNSGDQISFAADTYDKAEENSK